jgi:hypothetical protein
MADHTFIGVDPGVDGRGDAVGAAQAAVRPAIVRNPLHVDKFGAAEIDARLEYCAERLVRIGEALRARRLDLAHRDVKSDRQHHDLAPRQIRLVLATRHARVRDADRNLGAAGVIPVSVARDAWVVNGFETDAKIVLGPEVEIGVIAAAGIEDDCLETAVRVGRDHRDFVAAEQPPPMGPVAEPRQQELPVLDERVAHNKRRRAAKPRMELRRQDNSFSGRQRLRV